MSNINFDNGLLIDVNRKKYSGNTFDFLDSNEAIGDTIIDENKVHFYNLSLKINQTTGYGYFSGNVDENGTPVSVKIKLYIAGTKTLVQETDSFAHNGFFEFKGLADNSIYDMYAVYPNNKYETKVKENITCLKDYDRVINFNIVGVSKAPTQNSRNIRFTMIALNTKSKKPIYEIVNKPSWLDVNEKTGLCFGSSNTYIKSLVIQCKVYDGNDVYEFIRTVEFDDTRLSIEFNNNVNDLYKSFNLIKDIDNKVYEQFPKGGNALNLGNDYLQYNAKDTSFKDITSGSYTLEITAKVKTLSSNGVIFSSGKVYKNRFCVGYKNDKIYFNINDENVFTTNNFTLASIVANQWFVVTIVKDGSIYYGFFNGVLVHQWSNTSWNYITNDFYVGNNLYDNTISNDLSVRKIRFIKNLAEFDDTYETEYSFVDVSVAFPYTKLVEYNYNKPVKISDVILNGDVNKRFKNNGAYFADSYLNYIAYTDANSVNITLPNTSDVVDLSTSNWTLYFDVLLCDTSYLQYSSYNTMILSNNISGQWSSGIAFYLDSGTYYSRLLPKLVLNGTTYDLGNDNNIKRKLSLLQRTYFKVVRKKNYLYIFINGELSSKVSIGATKTYKFIGSGLKTVLGANRFYSTNSREYTYASTQGLILQKNIANIDNYDIFEKTVSKYHDIKFGYQSKYVDEYFTDKVTFIGTQSTTDRNISSMSTQLIKINDIYNMNDSLTLRLTGITFSTTVKQKLLTLLNSNGDYLKLYCDANGIGVDIKTTTIVNITNSNIIKKLNDVYDVMISSDGYYIRIFVDGVLLISYEIGESSILFDKCLIGNDIEEIQNDSLSSVALIEFSNDISFKDDLTLLLKHEYQKECDFKLMYHNFKYNTTAVNMPNLYTGVVPTKNTYNHNINELSKTVVVPTGDWTMEFCFTFTSTYRSSNQWIYTSYRSSDAYSHLYVYFDVYGRLNVGYTAIALRTNSNGKMNTYRSSTLYGNKDEKLHIALVRSGEHFKVFVNGEMVMDNIIPDFLPFNYYADTANIVPSLNYDSEPHYMRADIHYFRVLNGIALYQDTFDASEQLNNYPSEALNTFPTTTRLPTRYKDNFKN